MPRTQFEDVQEKLSSHPFMMKLLEHVRAYVEPHQDEIRAWVLEHGWHKKPTHPSGASGADAYTGNTFFAAVRLIEAADRLSLALRLMRKYPSRPNVRRELITPDTWIQYHYSMFVVQAAGIADVALMLTSQVFLLGLPPPQVGRETVLRNMWVESRPDVVVPLKRIWDLAARYREARNLHVHRGAWPEIHEIAEMIPHGIIERAGGALVPDRLLRRWYREATRETLERVQPDVKNFTEAASELFTGLVTQYDVRRRSFEVGTYR
jgi:hypothetical protein